MLVLCVVFVPLWVGVVSVARLLAVGPIVLPAKRACFVWHPIEVQIDSYSTGLPTC